MLVLHQESLRLIYLTTCRHSLSIVKNPSLHDHVEPLTFDYRALNPIAYDPINPIV